MAERRTQAERREATRSALMAAGRELFATHGYEAVSSEQIVAAAGVTRGALYHHFDGKRGLFAAVFEQVEAELAGRFDLSGLGQAGPLEALLVEVDQFLDGEKAVDLQAGGDQLGFTVTGCDGQGSAGIDRIHEGTLVDAPGGEGG